MDINPSEGTLSNRPTQVVGQSITLQQVAIACFLFSLSMCIGFVTGTYFWFLSEEIKSSDYRVLMYKIDQIPTDAPQSTTNIEFMINENAKTLLTLKDKLEEIKLLQTKQF